MSSHSLARPAAEAPSGAGSVSAGTLADTDQGGAPELSDSQIQRRIEEQVRARLLGRPLQATHVGRFTVLEEIGEGGMGTVYAAYDDQLDRKVAVKVLHDHELPSEAGRVRFQREAQALARLSHPNVVMVHEVGESDGRMYLAMEFVRGQRLDHWLRDEPPWAEVLGAFAQAGQGLQAAHEAGLVHRDFKPQNVMRGDDGTVKVLDFGLARAVETEGAEVTEASPVLEASVVEVSTGSHSLTVPGMILGTPYYMSPEQHRRQGADARSDQYSFCMALWLGLTGELPFEGRTFGVLSKAKHDGPPAWPESAPAVPRSIVEAIRRGLAVLPEDRFESMEALLEVLCADPAVRRRRLVAGAGLGLVLAAGAWGVVSLSGEVEQRDAVIEVQATEIEEQADELELKNAALERQLSIQRGLRARSLIGTGSEDEALLLGVQAVGAYAGAWPEAPPEAVVGLEQVLAHDTVIVEDSRVLQGHEDFVTSVAYSPDGTRLATTSTDDTVRLWDPTAGEVLAVLDAHEGDVYQAAFAPDGRCFATAGEDQRVRLWDTASGELLATLEGHQAPVLRVAFSPDGARLATAGAESAVRVWDVETAAPAFTLAGEGRNVITGLAYSPDGAHLATSGLDGKARVWNAQTGQPQLTLTGHDGPVLALAIAPDGSQLLTGGRDKTARVWSLPAGEPVATLQGHEDLVNNVAYSPDGQQLATGSWDRTVRVYDAATRKLVSSLEGGHVYGVADLAYAPDGERLVTGSFSGTLAVWNPRSGELRARLRGHVADAWALAFSPDGRRLATGSSDDTARIWDLSDLRVAVREGPETDVLALTYSPDQRELATVSLDGRVRQWDPETGELVRLVDELDERRGISLLYSRDGAQLLVEARGVLKSWDAKTGALRSTVTISERECGLHPSGGAMLGCRSQRSFVVVDAQSLQRLSTIEYDQDIRNHAWSFDDTRLAITTGGSTADLWDPRTGERLAVLDLPGDTILDLRVSRDGTQLATISEKDGLRVWDAHSLQPGTPLPGGEDVAFAGYLPEGGPLIGLSTSEGVLGWNPKTGEKVVHIADPVSKRHRFGASADGRYLVVMSFDRARIYDLRTQQQVLQLSGNHLGRRFGPGSTRFTVLDGNRNLEVWDIPTGQTLGRERVGLRQDDGTVKWPIPPHALARIGCMRLRVFEQAYPKAAAICEPMLGE